MSKKNNIIKILQDNGFNSHKHPEEYNITYVIENISLVELDPYISSVNVGEKNGFNVYINFKNGIINALNSCIDLDIYDRGFDWNGNEMLCYKFENENDFVKELHRLNSIGLNIKG